MPFIAALLHKKNVCLKKNINNISKSASRLCFVVRFYRLLFGVYFFCVLCFIFCFLFFHNVFDSVCSCFSPERRLFVAFYFARFSVFLLLLLLLPLSLLLLLHRKRLESQIPAWQRFIYNQSRFRLVTQPAESRLRRRLRRRCRQRVNVSVSLSLSLSCCLWWCCCSTRRSFVCSFVRLFAALFGVVVSSECCVGLSVTLHSPGMCVVVCVGLVARSVRHCAFCLFFFFSIFCCYLLSS